ncbi:hypothetical protein [Nocardia transvalensis]|uniref:hypothetical protein n=1 Tax=Nocardia transvalensis TaxID=37333 RepID=UPI0018963638|nr:hypothetical protein [Nocardia transvalensis]MBF6328973.1 hypothetical protein [Nocardia transvalensis]
MTDLRFDAPVALGVADSGVPAMSTPLHRAACRLQAALPLGWAVDIVDGTAPHEPTRQPILRVRMPEN